MSSPNRKPVIRFYPVPTRKDKDGKVQRGFILNTKRQAKKAAAGKYHQLKP